MLGAGKISVVSTKKFIEADQRKREELQETRRKENPKDKRKKNKMLLPMKIQNSLKAVMHELN